MRERGTSPKRTVKDDQRRERKRKAEKLQAQDGKEREENGFELGNRVEKQIMFAGDCSGRAQRTFAIYRVVQFAALRVPAGYVNVNSQSERGG